MLLNFTSSATPPARPNTVPKFRVFDSAGPALAQSPSPLRPQAWRDALCNYPGNLPNTLFGILTYGALVGYQGPPAYLFFSASLKSAELDPDTIENQLQLDLTRGRVSRTEPTPPFFSSPLGLVPKTDRGWRRIHHLSHPSDASINDCIPEAFGTLAYQSRANLLNLVRQAGRGATIIKRDLKDAFRLIPVAYKDRRLLGFEWRGQFYHENCLPFGLRTAPFLFNLFAEALHWLLTLLLPILLYLHYLDDFITIVPAHLTSYVAQFCILWAALTDFLGLVRNDSKDGMGTTLECLGIEIDTVLMEARLPPRKREKAVRLVTSALENNGLTLEECEQLTGFLNFCCEVVPLGRTFLRRLYNFQFAWRQPHARRPLSTGARDDLIWWKDLLPTAKGTHLIDDAARCTFHLFTDASSAGMGAFWYEGSPAQGNWRDVLPLPQEQAFALQLADEHQHINVSETSVVQSALAFWALHWSHGTLILHTDNNTALAGFTDKTVRGDAMTSLRESLLTAAAHDIQLHAVRVTSADNTLADALSRQRWATVANLCPHWQVPFPSNHLATLCAE